METRNNSGTSGHKKQTRNSRSQKVEQDNQSEQPIITRSGKRLKARHNSEEIKDQGFEETTTISRKSASLLDHNSSGSKRKKENLSTSEQDEVQEFSSLPKRNRNKSNMSQKSRKSKGNEKSNESPLDLPKSEESTNEKSEKSTKKKSEVAPTPESTATRDPADALKGLLSKLGASAELTPNPSMSRSKLTNLLQGLKAEGNEELQLSSLMELCDFLAMGTEDNMSNFSVDSFVPALIDLLNMEHNPDMMLMACRALSYLMEALPSSCSSVVSAQAVPVLCSRLLSIEYIDLAEQALQSLEKISFEHSISILKAGGLMACLGFLDFFPSGTQRTAISTAANICRQVPADCFNMVVDVIPILTQLVQHHDQKVVEKAVICFYRLAESFCNDEIKLSSLTKQGLLNQLLRMISTGTSGPGTSNYTTAIKLLTIFCFSSPSIVKILFDEGIVSIIQGILSSATSESPSLGTEQLFEILSLLNELLPSLPKEMSLFMPSNLRLSGFKSHQLVSKHETPESKDHREAIFVANPEILINFGESILPIVVQLFTSNINSAFKFKCLSVITKLVHFSSPAVLKTSLKDFSFSSFLAGLMASTDMAIVATAVQLSEILMEKLPDIFSRYFRREGVVFELARLSDLPNGDKSEGKPNETSSSKVQAWVVEHALNLRKRYFDDKEEASVSNELKILKAATFKLKTLSACLQSPDLADKGVLLDIKNSLCSEDGISGFEFLQSGAIEAILHFLNGDDLTKISESPEWANVLQARAALFCSVFIQPESTNFSEKNHPFLMLVRQLNNLLNKLEKFPIIAHEIPGAASAAVLKFLTQPFKLKLQRGNDDSSIRDFSDNLVLIEPLATVQAVHEFLMSRLKIDSLSSSKEIKEKSNSSDKMEMPNRTETETPGTDESEESLEEYEEDQSEGTPKDRVHDLNLGSVEPVSAPTFTLKLLFSDEELPSNVTMFQALQKLVRKQEPSGETSLPPPIHKMWEKVHTITYTLMPTTAQNNERLKQSGSLQKFKALELPYIHFLKQKLSRSIDCSESTFSVLALLRILHFLNTGWSSFFEDNKSLRGRGAIPPVEFYSSKLNSKLQRQLQDPLTLCSGALPDWCSQLTSKCEFLFPFETRKSYFLCTSFGIARALQPLQQNLLGSTGNRNPELRLGRIQRQKVRISRHKILDSAIKVMELYGKSKAILEVEYFNEVGTGLGPTLEFYTLVSEELQRKDLKLWRDSKAKLQDSAKHVHSSHGLFPSPRRFGEDAESTQILKLFKFMGTFVAKALLDNRLLDLPLSSAFLRWMIEKKLYYSDLHVIDNDFAAQMDKMAQLCRQKQAIERNTALAPSERTKQIEALNIGGCLVQDLDLDFTLPGRPDWELKPNGAKIPVNIFNLEEYLDLVVQVHLQTGVANQLDQFESGFNQVFPMENLSVLTVDELESMLIGNEEGAPWDVNVLMENTHCDHGFSHASPAVQYLFEVMTELDAEQRRNFLLFVTGSPRLPLGGFSTLEPKLTIVRKEHSSKDSPDHYLPSVNCCFYYLKLPDYSSKQILKEKLLFAIRNGQGHFSFN